MPPLEAVFVMKLFMASQVWVKVLIVAYSVLVLMLFLWATGVHAGWW